MDFEGTITPDGRASEEWNVHYLLGMEGIRSSAYSVKMVRRLIVQEAPMIIEMSREQKGLYLRDFDLHRVLDCNNPMVESAMKEMMVGMASDTPRMPEWSLYSTTVAGWMARLCGLTFIKAYSDMDSLEEAAVWEDRQATIVEAARAVFEANTEAMPYWRARATRTNFLPGGFFNPRLSAAITSPRPAWDSPQ